MPLPPPEKASAAIPHVQTQTEPLGLSNRVAARSARLKVPSIARRGSFAQNLHATHLMCARGSRRAGPPTWEPISAIVYRAMPRILVGAQHVDAETILLDGVCIEPVSVVATHTRGDNGGLQVERAPGITPLYSTPVPSAFVALTKQGHIRAWGDWEAGGVIPCDPRAYRRQNELVHAQPCGFGRTLYDWQTTWDSTQESWKDWDNDDWTKEHGRLDDRKWLLTPRDITQPKKTENNRVWVDRNAIPESTSDPSDITFRGMWADQTIYEMPGSWCTSGGEMDMNTEMDCGYKFHPCSPNAGSEHCVMATAGGGPFSQYDGFPSRTGIFLNDGSQTRVIAAATTDRAVAVITQSPPPPSNTVMDAYPHTRVFAWGHFTSDATASGLASGNAPTYSSSPALVPPEARQALEAGNQRKIFSTCCAFAVLMEAGNIVNWGDEGSSDRALPPSAQSLLNSGGAEAIYTTDGAFAAVSHKGEVFVWGDKAKGGHFPASLRQDNGDGCPRMGQKRRSICTGNTLDCQLITSVCCDDQSLPVPVHSFHKF